MVLTIASREPKKQGGWKYNAKPCPISRARISALPLATDREILSMLAGGGPFSPYSQGPYDPYDRGADTFSLPSALAQTILPMVLRTGRCFLPFEKDEMERPALLCEDSGPWRFVLEVKGSPLKGWQLSGNFCRDGQRMGVDEPLLTQALRPFLLRRTKEQVARELPPKIEQTIYCEMEPGQRALYNELRRLYRESLLSKIAKVGIAKAKIQVLEVLLRLRQAACHPGLIDRKRVKEPSAKLDVLFDQLGSVLEEGHKALVFSQFTSLLSILGTNLKSNGIEYEYLDGKTQDRQAPVERFQNDPASRLFLISLKAGGLGLNLTAADYVLSLIPGGTRPLKHRRSTAPIASVRRGRSLLIA